MKLYVCWGTFQVPKARAHPCRLAHEALLGAGHGPEVIRTYGYGGLPDITKGRREVSRLGGSSWVPLLLAGDEVVQGSDEIIAWAGANPASG